MSGVTYPHLKAPTIDGAPTIVRLPKKVKPEDITIDDLRHLSNESFTLWTQTSGVTVDGNNIDFNAHRYLLPIYLCNDTEIVWQKAAQMGATVYMLLKVIHWLHTHQGRKAGLYFPTKEGVENLSKDRLTPLLQSIPELNGTIDTQDKLGLRKIGKSSFYLFHLGGVASKDSVPLDFVSFDEVRLCKPQEIDQALERISHSPYKQKVFMSTCHSKDTRILVRKKQDVKYWKVSNPVESKSFRELEDCWHQYQVLCQYQSNGLNYTFRDITAFHDNGIKPVVKALFDDGTEVVATHDHEYAWCDAFGKSKNILRWEQLSKLTDKNAIVTLRNISQYEEIDTPFDLLTYYVFGAYAAEGCVVTGTTNTISIAQLKKTDTPIRSRVIEWAQRNGFKFSEQRTCIRVSLKTRPDLYQLFESFGKSSSDKRFPEIIRNGSVKQLRELLDGYIDGDGTRRTDHSWDITTTSYAMLYDLKLIALRVGEPAYIRDYEGRTENRAHSYQLCHNANSNRILSRPLNAHYRAARLVELREWGNQAVCDITVDQYHNFVLENGIVAHNCGLPENDIAARFDLGTQHIWMAKCGCPDGVDLARAFPDCVVDDKKRGKLYLRCPKCRFVINDPQNGRYVAHNPGADYTSFHVSQLTSKYMPLKTLWDFYYRTTNKAEFFNAKLGLPYVDEENRGVTLGQLKSCVDPMLEWAAPGKAADTAMGVDVGGGYCYVIIADLHESKKRIRHVEIIESDNPHYMEAGKRVSPFKRLRTLMKEYKVQLCVIDAMPNYDSVLEFAQEFPGKVFASFYSKEAKDVVTWSDKPRTKVTIKKAGPLLKFKYYCVVSRYLSLDVALGQWAGNDVICPDPDRLVQMCLNEKTKDLEPEAVMNRAFSMFMRLIKRFNVSNEETGEGRHEWIYSGGDPHFAHAWNYCNVALERMRRGVIFTFG